MSKNTSKTYSRCWGGSAHGPSKNADTAGIAPDARNIATRVLAGPMTFNQALRAVAWIGLVQGVIRLSLASMQLHRGVGLFSDHSREGKERGFEDAVNGQFVQFVQRQVHELGKIPLDHQTFADQATHHVAHCAEFAQRHQ